MADDQKFLDQEAPQQEEDVEIGKKVGFLPAVVIKILKWTAIGLVITFLVVVLVLGNLAGCLAIMHLLDNYLYHY